MKHGWSNLKEVLQKTFWIREKVDMALTGLIVVPSESIYPLICKPLPVELLDQFKTWLSQLLEMEVGKEYVQLVPGFIFFLHSSKFGERFEIDVWVGLVL